ncbi:MAG: hypothetical protein ABUM51_01295 [Bacteroidota bacterium]
MEKESSNEKDLSQETIDRFDMDMAVLLCFYTLTVVAEAMGMEASNLSNYLKKVKNRRHPLTQNIVDKLYNAWGVKLREIYAKRAANFEGNFFSESIVNEETLTYTDKEHSDKEFINELRKNLTTVIKSNATMADTNHILAATTEIVVNAHFNKQGQQVEKPNPAD